MADYIPRTINITVASSGTAEQVSSTDVLVTGFAVTADPDNTGRIHVGDINVASSGDVGMPLDASAHVEYTPPQISGTEGYVNLSDIYIDAATSGDKAIVIYWEQVVK